MDNAKKWIKYKLYYDSLDEMFYKCILPFIEENCSQIKHFNFTHKENTFFLMLFIDENNIKNLEIKLNQKCNVLNNEELQAGLLSFSNESTILDHCININQIICDNILLFYNENGDKVNYSNRLGYAIQLLMDTYKIAGIHLSYAKKWSQQTYDECLNQIIATIPENDHKNQLIQFVLQKLNNQFEKSKKGLFNLIKKIWENDYITDFAKVMYYELNVIKRSAEKKKINIKTLMPKNGHAFYTMEVFLFFLKNIQHSICNKLGLYGADELYILYSVKEAVNTLFESSKETDEINILQNK